MEILKKVNENLIVIDYSNLTVYAIQKTIKQIKMKNHIDLIFVDHLNIMSYGKLDEYNGITEATRLFKVIAKEEQIACCILTQLNRDVKTRKDKRPVLSDLRGSNSIAQDADFVYMLHREQYYYTMLGVKDECPEILKNKLEGWFAKSRRGEGTKQYFLIDLSTKKIIRELEYDFINKSNDIINEIEEYENCLALNDSVESVKEKNKNDKKTFFGKTESNENFRKNNSNMVILAGNVATSEMTEELLLKGASIVKVGIGGGCFTGGTLITTTNGYKQIKDICVNEKVLTHTMKWREVKNIFEFSHHKKKIIFNSKITTTPNHEFYVLHKKFKNFVTDENIHDFAEWMPAENITKDYFLIKKTK